MSQDVKKTLFLFSLLTLVGISLPLQTHAFIAELASNIFFGIFAVGLLIVANISMVAVGIVAGLLDWAMSPGGFIFLPYTSGGVVDIGWAITRDLTNIGFVLGLVVIGLATALRYGDYQAKKALPKLILMALLVNFTPVIVGILVDAGNIIMKFFLTETVSSDAWLRLIQGIWGGGPQSMGILDFVTKPMSLVLLAKSASIIVFSFITASFLFLYFLLFLMRYVAIWLLVIASPLAFFAWIFPDTKSYFSQWWSQFLHWNFIGVSAAFVLYLSQQLLAMVLSTSMPIVSPPGGADILGINNVLSNILPYSVVSAFMLIGFMGAMQSSAMGASGVMSAAQGFIRGTGEIVGRGAKGWAKTQFVNNPLSKAVVKRAERLTQIKTPFGLTAAEKTLPWYRKMVNPKVMGKMLVHGSVSPFYDAVRSAGAGAQNFYDVAKKDIEVSKAKVKGMTIDQVVAAHFNMKDTGDLAGLVGQFEGLKEDGRLKDFTAALEKTGMSKDEVAADFEDIMIKAQGTLGKIDAHKEIATALPQLSVPRQTAAAAAVAAAAAKYGITADKVTARQAAGMTAADITAVAAADITAANKYVTADHLAAMKPTQVSAVTPVQLAKPYQEFFKNLKTARAGQLSDNLLLDPSTGNFASPQAELAMTNMVRVLEGSQAGAFLTTYRQAGADAIEKAIDILAGGPVGNNPSTGSPYTVAEWRGEWLQNPAKGNNPRLYNYFTKGSGRGQINIA